MPSGKSLPMASTHVQTPTTEKKFIKLNADDTASIRFKRADDWCVLQYTDEKDEIVTVCCNGSANGPDEHFSCTPLRVPPEERVPFSDDGDGYVLLNNNEQLRVGAFPATHYFAFCAGGSHRWMRSGTDETEYCFHINIVFAQDPISPCAECKTRGQACKDRKRLLDDVAMSHKVASAEHEDA